MERRGRATGLVSGRVSSLLPPWFRGLRSPWLSQCAWCFNI
jgi:hypothetical protein